MYDFLTFSRFIAQDILIFFYYVGVSVLPVLFYLFRDRLPKVESKRFILLFVVAVLFAQIVWRMMFEAMIGYFDMHDYLYEIRNALLR